MSAFEDFVNLELPKRPPMLTLANTGYDNDPNGGGAPAVIQNSPQGTFFFRTTGNILYTKNTSAPGTWTVVGSGGGSAGVTKTTAPITYYVSPSGFDTNPGTLLLPFLTIQAALDAVPKLIQHLVTINVAAGSYAGWRCEGFSVAGLVAGDFAGLNMQAAYGTFVPLTGTGSGTATSTVTGQFLVTPSTFTVLNDTTQAWTVDNLKGQYLYITSGTGNGGMFPIISNTATSLTVQSVGAIGATSTYVIREQLTLITSAVRAEPTIPTSTQITTNTGLLAGAHFINNISPRGTADFRVEGFKFAVTTAGYFYAIQSQSMDSFTIARCSFINAQAGTSQQLRLEGEGLVSVQQCYFDNSISGTSIGVANESGIQILNCYLKNTGATVAMSIGRCTNLLISACTVDGGAFGITCTPSSPSAMNISSTKIYGTSSQAFRIRNAASSCDLTVTGLDVGLAAQYTGSTGFEVFGFHSATITRLFTTNYLTGLSLALGAQVQIDALSSMTGTAGIAHDGLSTSLDIMRAAPGKVLIGPANSVLRE